MMSHFTTVKTQFVVKEYLKSALADLGYEPEEDTRIRGWFGLSTGVEFKIAMKKSRYDVGFRKKGDTYEMVADWMGVRDFSQKDFLARLAQRYAYHATRAKLEEQGFTIAGEETTADGQIRLVLRRMA
jgi:hypothetical protein